MQGLQSLHLKSCRKLIKSTECVTKKPGVVYLQTVGPPLQTKCITHSEQAKSRTVTNKGNQLMKISFCKTNTSLMQLSHSIRPEITINEVESETLYFQRSMSVTMLRGLTLSTKTFVASMEPKVIGMGIWTVPWMKLSTKTSLCAIAYLGLKEIHPRTLKVSTKRLGSPRKRAREEVSKNLCSLILARTASTWK